VRAAEAKDLHVTNLPVSRGIRRRTPEAFKRWLKRRHRGSEGPTLSVVVPIFDTGPRLHRCLASLAGQAVEGLEVILVDDGSRDGSLDIARMFAAQHPCVQVIEQPHRGLGPARDAGVQAATGEFLAFCDSDDEVPPGAYGRMISALRTSGSDIAIGSLVLQEKGMYRQPDWVRRSNPDRLLGVNVDEVPELMANLLPGTRMFRRSFWEAFGFSFGEDDHRDMVTMVQAVLAARTIDVLPSVVYRWGWRESGTSLLQRDLREVDRVRCKMRHILEASELVLAQASAKVQRHFFMEVLHTVTPDLVRAGLTRDDGYWSALQGEMQTLTERIPDEDLERVPVEDRITAWLCARAERRAAEDFLEYAFDNKDGYPFRDVDGHPHIKLPFIDALAPVDSAMTRVADVDMSYHTRLTAMRWVRTGVLRLEGAAFIDYVERSESDQVTVILRDRSTGAEKQFPAFWFVDQSVNRWAGRAQEDHSNDAFECEVDIAALPSSEDSLAVYDVTVRLELGSRSREAAFQSRRVIGSPGLLERSVVGSQRVTPAWNPIRGLILRVTPADDMADANDEDDERASGPVLVTEIDGDDGTVVLRLSADQPYELALVGPRCRTDWVTPTKRQGTGFSATLSLLLDEWGTGLVSLPTDDYAVIARTPETGDELPVRVDRQLWRELPLSVDTGTHLILPGALEGGRLQLRVAPGENRNSVGSYVRRRLRDEHYPAAREMTLLDVALFETFHGRAAGDNPGPLCAELARRDSGLDLVFSVVDRSVSVPDGARSVVRWSTEWFELLGRARYFVTNAPLPPFFRKREGQVFLHTWHGSPLKRIAHDRVSQDFANWHHRRQLLVARGGWDYLISQSPFCTEALRSAFLYDGKMLELGYPRNDLLSSPKAEEVRRRTREHLGIAPESRVILYAPTWRDNYRVGRVFDKIVFLETAEVVRQVPDSVVLVRGHYNSMEDADVQGTDRRVLDVTRYPDISDLYLAADALVTDYSSVFFDFILTDKPMYFLAPDLAEYRDHNRGFYLDYHETVPGPVAVTTQQVVDALLGPDEHVEVRKRFRAEYAPWDDGHASERIVDVLLRHQESAE
jgi:CDP-glycerol glycerophosphotransferase (TagB/SpsB family)